MQIVFHESGDIEFTRSPDLLKCVDGIGRLAIERMTDILFDEEAQRYVIRFLKGPLEGFNLSTHLRVFPEYIEWYGSEEFDVPVQVNHVNGVISYRTYEDAVKAEISFVEYLRDMGYSMT